MTSEERRFWKDAYLAALPSVMKGDEWHLDGKPLRSVSERSIVAARIATAAVGNLREAMERMKE